MAPCLHPRRLSSSVTIPALRRDQSYDTSSVAHTHHLLFSAWTGGGFCEVFFDIWCILSRDCTVPSSHIWATSRWTSHRNDNKKWLKEEFEALKQQRNWCNGGSGVEDMRTNKRSLIYFLHSVYLSWCSNSVTIVITTKKWWLRVLFVYIYVVLYLHQTSVQSCCSWEVRIQGHLTSLKQFLTTNWNYWRRVGWEAKPGNTWSKHKPLAHMHSIVSVGFCQLYMKTWRVTQSQLFKIKDLFFFWPSSANIYRIL